MSNTNDGSAPTGNQIPEYPEAPKGQGEPTGSRRASASFTNAPAQVPAPAVAMTSLPPEGSQTPEDIFRIFQLLWRHKILVLCLMAVGTVCGFLLAQRATPVYQSQARLSVVYHAPPKEGWDPGVSENEYQRNFDSILREATSRNVMLRAADRIIERQDVPSLQALSRNEIADSLSGGAGISPVQHTNHVMYTFNSVNIEEAPVILDYLVKAFRDDQRESRSDLYSKEVTDLLYDEAQKRREYEQFRQAYNDFKLQNQIDDIEATRNRYAMQLNDLRVRMAAADDDVLRKQTLMVGIDPNDDEELLNWLKASPQNGYLLQGAQQELDRMKRDLSDLRKKYEDVHPDIQKLLAAIDEKYSEMIKIARSRYQLEKQNIDAALAVQAKLNKDKLDLDTELALRLPLLNTAISLREQMDVAQANWKAIADRKMGSSNSSNKQYTEIKSVEPITSADKVYPRAMFFVGSGGMIGLAIAILIVLFWSRIDDTLKTSVQVPRELGIPTLGTVLFSPAIGPDPSGLPLVSRLPRSPEAEALFIVWANIATRLNLQPGTCKVVMLSSSIPEEGKSTTSANIAAVAAQQNLRVLLIDLDLRRPSLHNYFGITNAVGCIQALNRHMRREQCVQRTAVKNLDILTTGTGDDHPNELVSPQNLMGLLAWARGNYDLVVLDTPPLLLAADGLIVSRFIDGAVLVIHGGQTPLDTVTRSRDMLLGANANLLGAILNDRTGAVDDRDRSYYYKYSSYYHQPAVNE